MNAIERFDEIAARRGAAAAVVWDGPRRSHTLSFAALGQRSRALATQFTRSGLVRGDAVIVLLPFGATFLEVTGALLRCGVTAVFIDPVRWRATLGVALAALPVRGFVGSTKACALRWLVPELRAIHPAFVDGHWPGARSLAEAANLPPQAQSVACDAGTVALVSFTSGTTGLPKAVVRTHGVLEAMQRMLAREIELAPGEVHLSMLPFAVLAELGAGATCVIPAGNVSRLDRLDVARIAAQIRTHGVEVIAASPTVAERLATEAIGSASFASVRRVYIGGAPVLPRLLDLWRRAAPAARIGIVYGMTEAEPIATLAGGEYGDEERRATSAGAGLLVGYPVQGAVVRIAALSNRSQGTAPPAFVAAGVEGEIVVGGPHVSPGYLGRSSDRLEGGVTDRVHGLRTGDAGYFDARGRLWLTGRCQDGVVLNSTTIHPLRVEAALADDPSIARSAFLLSDNARILAIQPHELGSRLALERIAASVAFAAPERIVIVDRIPMDARHEAKVDYRRLAADIAGGRVRQWHRPAIGARGICR
jgi:olefin beta-lactone synthetase